MFGKHHPTDTIFASKLESDGWRLLQIFEISCVPRAFFCHATEKDLKMDSAEFQHKSAIEFSQKESHSIKLKTVF